MIESEDDVRAWVRKASGGKARWVEPALGSTPGLPDCWVPWKRRARVDLELKAGEIRGNRLHYYVRPEQAREMRLSVCDGLACGILVGVKKTNSLFFILPEKIALNGVIDLVAEDRDNHSMQATLDDKESFWIGVEFVYKKTERMIGANGSMW